MISTNGHVTIKLISLINNLSLSIDFLICCRFHKWVTSIHTAPEYRIVQEKNLLPQPHKFIYVKLNTMHSFELISLITCQHSLEMMYLYFYGWFDNAQVFRVWPLITICISSMRMKYFKFFLCRDHYISKQILISKWMAV